MLTHTTEQYLKAIHRLHVEGGRVSTTALAQTLGVKPASVTNMLQRLSQTDPPLVDFKPYKGVTFTEEGRKAALRAIRNHRLLELFLHRLLGYSWDRVHEEAERMDHVISEEFGEKIAGLLCDPRFDPHGDPIPTRDLKIPELKLIPLLELETGQSRVIRRVLRDEPEFLCYLSDLGLVPGTMVKVSKREPFNGPITLAVKSREGIVERLVGDEIAGEILVDREQK